MISGISHSSEPYVIATTAPSSVVGTAPRRPSSSQRARLGENRTLGDAHVATEAVGQVGHLRAWPVELLAELGVLDVGDLEGAPSIAADVIGLHVPAALVAAQQVGLDRAGGEFAGRAREIGDVDQPSRSHALVQHGDDRLLGVGLHRRGGVGQRKPAERRLRPSRAPCPASCGPRPRAAAPPRPAPASRALASSGDSRAGRRKVSP